MVLRKTSGEHKKGHQWAAFQPILHPTAADFEERIVYNNGDYFAKSYLEVEARNLIGLLQLDNLALAGKRKRYIRRKAADMAAYEPAYEQDATAFFNVLIESNRCEIMYPRALKEEFGIDVLQMLP